MAIYSSEIFVDQYALQDSRQIDAHKHVKRRIQGEIMLKMEEHLMSNPGVLLLVKMTPFKVERKADNYRMGETWSAELEIREIKASDWALEHKQRDFGFWKALWWLIKRSLNKHAAQEGT